MANHPEGPVARRAIADQLRVETTALTARQGHPGRTSPRSASVHRPRLRRLRQVPHDQLKTQPRTSAAKSAQWDASRLALTVRQMRASGRGWFKALLPPRSQLTGAAASGGSQRRPLCLRQRGPASSSLGVSMTLSSRRSMGRPEPPGSCPTAWLSSAAYVRKVGTHPTR
jgi:hypothetical protein